MIKKSCIVRKIVIFVVLFIGIFSFCKIYSYKEYRTYDSILIRYNIVNKTYQKINVSRAEAIISLSKILGASDDWASRGICGTNPALIETYSDYPEFVADYDNLSLGYMGLLSSVICAVDTEKNGYQIKLRPKDNITKKEALEYMLFCIENKNADKNKSIIYRAINENLIDYRDLISFSRLNDSISEKQYHKILYNLLNHNRYLFLNKETNLYIGYDLDSYFDTSMSYKQYLDGQKEQ